MTRDNVAREKMVRARSGLVLEMPFFAHLAMRLELYPDASCASAWTNGSVLAFNPSYVEAMPLEKLKGLLCHEVLHLACLHHLRRDKRDKATWNRACDYAINPILLESGVELPTGFLDDPLHYGKSAEEIYSAIREIDRERNDYQSDNPATGHGEEESEDNGSSTLSEQGEDDAQTSSSEITSESPDRQGNSPGNEDEGQQEPTDVSGNSDPGMAGEVRDAEQNPEGSLADPEALYSEQEEQWAEALSQAVRKQREAGELPGSLERLLQDRFVPTLSWREILQRFLSRAARNDFSWMRPNRRYLHTGLILPGLQSEELDEVVVVLDVSGSVDEESLQRFWAEITTLLDDYDMSVTLLTSDAAVHQVLEVKREDLPLQIASAGGGGTDYRPAFNHVEERGQLPTCLIYLTDLNCNRFPVEPEYPVLWVTPNLTTDQPPFGELIPMESR